MEDLEQQLRNIDVFLRILVKKIAEGENCSKKTKVEPIESLLRKKHTIKETPESNLSAKHMIPLPQAEEPLVDVFEDDKYVRILMQHRCKNQEVVIRTDIDGIEICAKECKKLSLPMKHLQTENMMVRYNNEAFEINIPKITQQ